MKSGLITSHSPGENCRKNRKCNFNMLALFTSKWDEVVRPVEQISSRSRVNILYSIMIEIIAFLDFGPVSFNEAFYKHCKNSPHLPSSFRQVTLDGLMCQRGRNKISIALKQNNAIRFKIIG